MFEIRLEARYGEKMRKCDIEAAREILSHTEKLADAACHMRDYNRYNFMRSNPDFRRAAKNIVRFYNMLEESYREIESLHDCYLAQFTEFDNDGEIIDTLPDFDSSDASLIDEKSLELWLDAQISLVKAVSDFAVAKGYYDDLPGAYDNLKKGTLTRYFIKYHIAPEISATKITAPELMPVV